MMDSSSNNGTSRSLSHRRPNAFCSICDQDALLPTLVGIVSHAIYGVQEPWIIFATGLSEEDIDLVSRVEKWFKLEISVREIGLSDQVTLATPREWRSLVWLKLSLPRLAEGKFERIAYLDSDTLAMSNTHSIFNEDLCGKPMGAVRSPQDHSWRFEQLGLPQDSQYFNAGVLLIDVDQFLEHEIESKVLSYAAANQSSLGCAEQCALNAGAAGYIQHLDDSWNYLVGYAEVTDATPKILHFAGPLKPWNHESYPGRAYFYFLLNILDRIARNGFLDRKSEQAAVLRRASTPGPREPSPFTTDREKERRAQTKGFDEKRVKLGRILSKRIEGIEIA